MIKLKPAQTAITLDLTGPEGNAFNLLKVAGQLSNKLGYSDDEHLAMFLDMQSGDYEHLVQTFDRHFGDFVILLRNEV